MIRALVKADQVRVWGESAIVPHNPACRCSFIWMKRSKKKGFVKARPPCATATELGSSPQYSLSFSNALPLSLSRTLSSSLCFFLSFSHWCFSLVTRYVEVSVQPFCCEFCLTLLFHSKISMLCIKLWIVMRGLCDSHVYCAVLPCVIRHQRRTH